MKLYGLGFSVAHAPVFFLFPPCGKMMQQVMPQRPKAAELMSHLRKSQNMNMRHTIYYKLPNNGIVWNKRTRTIAAKVWIL